MAAVDEKVTERSQTIRRQIGALLAAREMDARALALELGLKEKEIDAHLAHVARSAAAARHRFVVTPSRCALCGFVFAERRRLTRPGRCPRCRRSVVLSPSFRIL
jgi:hypothetical protein